MDLAVERFGQVQKVPWDVPHARKAKRICYRCVTTECHFRNYGNLAIPEALQYTPNDGVPSHGGDKNSLGLYQQRQPWWGDVAGMMTPYIATWRFLVAMLRDAPGWFTGDEPTTCQQVQRSQYDGITINPATGVPYPFAANYAGEQVRTDALDADPLHYSHGGT